MPGRCCATCSICSAAISTVATRARSSWPGPTAVMGACATPTCSAPTSWRTWSSAPPARTASRARTCTSARRCANPTSRPSGAAPTTTSSPSPRSTPTSTTTSSPPRASPTAIAVARRPASWSPAVILTCAPRCSGGWRRRSAIRRSVAGRTARWRTLSAATPPWSIPAG